MFPIAVILTVGIKEKNRDIAKYVLPFSITGWVIALYQNLLIYGVISHPIYSCTLGADCTDKGVTFLGFITFPLLSLAAFTIINICMMIYAGNKNR
jgi:disulfide bond formation protein DsbB